MLKKVLKTLWIASLSTLMKLLAQNLTRDGISGLPTLGSIPYQYIIGSFLMFVSLTILFIFIVDYLPFNKMFKGIFYAFFIGLLWTSIMFKPETFKSIEDYFVGIAVLITPLMVFGVFLGYLSNDKKISFKFHKSLLTNYVIGFLWLLFHIMFMVFSPPGKDLRVNYIIWIVITSIVVSVVIGFFYEIHINSKYNTLLITSIIIAVIFINFYADRFISDRLFEWIYLIRLLLDVVSIMLSIQVLELFKPRMKVEHTKLKEDK